MDVSGTIEPNPWEPHFHENEEGERTHRHVHAPGSKLSFAIEIPLQVFSEPDTPVTELMLFRAEVSRMRAQVEHLRDETNLEEHSPVEQSFMVLTVHADLSLFQGVTQAIDQILTQRGVTPPASLISLESSNIAAAGFVEPAQPVDASPADDPLGVLYIAFHDGGLYRYADVPRSVAGGFYQAASHGQFFHANIKGNYEFTRIEIGVK